MSAERSRFFGPLERRAVVLAFACTACLTLDFSDTNGQTEHSSARYIDDFCQTKHFELEGSAKKTSGLTSDSCGFSVGPGPGVVHFIVEKSVTARYTNYTFDVLVISEDGTDGRWLTLTEEDRSPATLGYSVSDANGRVRHIVDVRLQGEIRPGTLEGCSVARRPRR